MDGMAKTWIGVAAFVVAFSAYVWFMWPEEPPPAEPITLQEAQSVLDELATHAEAGRFDLLCERSSTETMCRWHLDEAGWRNVPLVRPQIALVSDYSTPERAVVLLLLCGTRADGSAFASGIELSRYRSTPNIEVPFPVYWWGGGVMLPGYEPSTIAPSIGGDLSQCAELVRNP